MKHIISIQRQSPAEIGWVQVPYYIKENNNFFLANLNQPIAKNEYDSLESDYYVKIDPPLQIDDDQGIWIDLDNNVWVANQKNPFIETEKSFKLDFKLSEI